MLAIDYNDTFHLNKAGALFFAKDITKFDIEHEIKMVRFNGIEPVDIIDKLFSYKSFFKLIEDFNNFFDRNTRLGGTLKVGKEFPYPSILLKLFVKHLLMQLPIEIIH